MTADSINRELLQLAPRALLDLPDVSGVQVLCRRGSLWITLDNDPRDIVLEAGESFYTTEHRRGLVYALEDSVVGLRTVEALRELPSRARNAAVQRSAFAR